MTDKLSQEFIERFVKVEEAAKRLDSLPTQVSSLHDTVLRMRQDVATIKTDTSSMRKSLFGNGTEGIVDKVRGLEGSRKFILSMLAAIGLMLLGVVGSTISDRISKSTAQASQEAPSNKGK